MTSMVKPLPLTLIAFGFACVGCEVLGAYEFLWEQHHKWSYLVIGGMLVTALAGILPLAAEHARRNRQWAKMALCWLAIPFALLFVLTAGVQRTGLVADTDEATRTTRALAIVTAQEEIAEAKAQRIRDQAAIDSICGIWGPKCTAAREALVATEAKLTAARRSITDRATVTENGMSKRIVEFLPFLTEKQVQLYHPLLLPLMLGVLGALCIGIGAHQGAPPKPTKVETEPVVPVAALEPRQTVSEPEPVAVPVKPARPRLVPKGKAHEADVFRILRAALVPTKGSHVELGEALDRYTVEGGTKCEPNEFMRAVMAHCKAEKIKMDEISGQPCLLDVALVPLTKRESA
jgi:hypothetical protein